MTTVPEIRFPEFDGRWEKSELRRVATGSCLGGNYRNSLGKTSRPLIKMGNIGRGSIDVGNLNFISDDEVVDEVHRISSGDLFLNTRNTLDLVGKVAIWRDELPRAYFNSNLLRLDFPCNQFMNVRLNTIEGIKSLRRIAAGTTSVAAIYSKDLFRLKVSLPTLPEQQKIAAFLGAVDDKIDALRRKHDALKQFKAGLMQKLFSQQLRFKRDDGSDYPDWEEKRLGDLLIYEQPTKYLVESTEYSDCYKTPVLTAGKTFILGYTDEEHGIFKPNQPIILFDDFTTASQFVDFPFKLKSSAAKILKPAHPHHRAELLHQILMAIRYDSSDHKRHWISIFAEFIVEYPSADEENRIADCLVAMNAKIEAVERQITHMDGFKKGLLHKMFV